MRADRVPIETGSVGTSVGVDGTGRPTHGLGQWEPAITDTARGQVSGR
jgi:hypothetical protein